jgi:flagellar hook protein FlgE
VDINAGNTEVNIINPAIVDTTSTANYDLVYDPDGALAGAGPWKWNGDTPASTGDYASDAIIVNTANRVTIDLDADGLADIEYNFQDTLATDTPPVPAAIWGGIEFGLSGTDNLRTNNTPPAEYAGAQILAGSNEDAVSIDLTGNGTADITYSFTNALSEDGTINFDIDTHIPPAEYQNAQILVANSDAGKINIDVDGDGISNMLFTFQDSAVTPVLQNLNANSTFIFDIDPRVPPEEYSNATISGDEKEVKLDMDNDSNDDIRFTFTSPLSTGPVAIDSEILFNIEGTTAWTAQSTNDDGYFEFTTDFLGGANGATVQNIEFDVGTKDDGTGQFINDSLSTTQFARPSSTVFQSADGFGAGDLEGVDVSSDGIITGIYSNGELIPLYRVALAKFQNNQGLFKEGNNLFRETRDSGSAITNRPGENGLGSISPNSLEMSNVDVANEFVKMITTQRGYQANSKIITTVDSMLGDAIQMKR